MGAHTTGAGADDPPNPEAAAQVAANVRTRDRSLSVGNSPRLS